MGFPLHWQYRIILALLILYVIATCIIASALLWNISYSQFFENTLPESAHENQSVVSLCAIEKSLRKDPLLQCSLLDGLIYERFIASGWTKIVHQGKLVDGSQIAIKSVNINGKDIFECTKSNLMLKCHNDAVEKIIREINLLKQLKHETIIKLLFYCSKTAGDNLCMKHALVGTEVGDTLTNLKLLQLNWKERKQVIQDLASLIHYAANSPIGKLGLADLRRPQFVLVNGRLKLADLDDVIVGERSCTSLSDCSGLNVTVPCISGSCEEYNAKLNIQRSFREFGPYIFITEGVPNDRKIDLMKLHHLWRENNVTTDQLLAASLVL